jgi:hypothetical protein
MAKDKRYHISKDGKTLTDRNDGTTFSVATFKVSQTGKISSVFFNDGIEGKRQAKLARHTIDETDFSFGEAKAKVHLRKIRENTAQHSTAQHSTAQHQPTRLFSRSRSSSSCMSLT